MRSGLRGGILRMVLVACAVAPPAALAQLDPGPTDHILVTPSDPVLSLAWSDLDDVLRGGIQPAPLAAHHPFTVSLRLDPTSGPPYDVPLVITLRRAGEEQGVSQVVRRAQDGWSARFTPGDAGPYLLDVSFRTTRSKVLHAGLAVRPAGVPEWAWALLALTLLGGTLLFWRARRQELRPPGEAAR